MGAAPLQFVIHRLTALFTLAVTLAPLGAGEQQTSALGLRLRENHQKFLESRRSLLGQLSDPYQVAPKARVVEEEPEPWIVSKTSWQRHIRATVFWVGEEPTERNPTPNDASSWDPNWQENFGGVDDPKNRSGFLPAGFLPKQTPFYVALPYNDLAPGGGHQAEAAEVIPWFWRLNKGPNTSVCHGRWLALHRNGRICYARWRDAGPYTTDDWEYVFMGKRPRPNPNGNAGIDVSPAVRDYLGMKGNELVDWKFVGDSAVPDGPWKNWHPLAQ